jgi:hypothetical protein
MREKANFDWSRIIQIIVSVGLALLISVIGFLVHQVMSLRDAIAEFRLCEANHYNELSKEVGLQKLTMENLANKVDCLVEVQPRRESRP